MDTGMKQDLAMKLSEKTTIWSTNSKFSQWPECLRNRDPASMASPPPLGSHPTRMEMACITFEPRLSYLIYDLPEKVLPATSDDLEPKASY
jgi:hypothetical protein